MSKTEPQEITIKGTNRAYVITGVRVWMQMAANTGQGIYKLKIFNRELKLLNSSNTDKKNVDIALSNAEILYAYLQNQI